MLVMRSVGAEQGQPRAPFKARGHGAIGRDTSGDLNGDRAVLAGVLDGVVDQVLDHLQDLVAIPGHHGPARGAQLLVQAHAPVGRKRAQPVQHVGDSCAKVHQAGGGDVFVEFDAAQRQQVVDQPRHAVGLLGHDGEEAVASGRVVLGVAPQGLDEPRERGQRRAQFVAGVGQEVGAHPLIAPGVRLVAHPQQREVLAVLGGERFGDGAPGPVARPAFIEQGGGFDPPSAGPGGDRGSPVRPDRILHPVR